MAVPPSEHGPAQRTAVFLRAAAGRVAVRPPGSPRRSGDVSRSHLADGRVVTLRRPRCDPTGNSIAIDAEIAGQQPPATLSRQFGSVDQLEFWWRWTRMEVTCKLLDVPVLVWLRRHGLDVAAAPIELMTFLHAGVVVSIGVRQHAD